MMQLLGGRHVWQLLVALGAAVVVTLHSSRHTDRPPSSTRNAAVLSSIEESTTAEDRRLSFDLPAGTGFSAQATTRQVSESPFERAREGLAHFEAAVRVTAILEITWLLERGYAPRDQLRLLSANFARPSLGRWVSYHRWASRAVTAIRPTSDLDWILPIEDRFHLVAMRNGLAHGSATKVLRDGSLASASEAVEIAVRTRCLYSPIV